MNLFKNKKPILLAFTVILILSANVFSNESMDDYETEKKLAYGGISVFFSGIGLEVMSVPFFLFGAINVSRPLIGTGIALLSAGVVSELIVGPVLSIVANNNLIKKSLIDDKIYNRTAFWYGISWISQTALIGGIVLLAVGLYELNPISITLGIALFTVGYISAIAFRSVAFTIPLISWKI